MMKHSFTVHMDFRIRTTLLIPKGISVYTVHQDHTYFYKQSEGQRIIQKLVMVDKRHKWAYRDAIAQN